MAWIMPKDTMLTEDEALNNVNEFYKIAGAKGMTKKAVAAICGNAWVESSVNPNVYEFGYAWADDRGFGLVQWTPRSVLERFASARGYDIRLGETQVLKIFDELEAEQELDYSRMMWYRRRGYDFSFNDFAFTDLSLSVEEMASAFLYCYENPQHPEVSLEKRQAFARKALDFLEGKEPPEEYEPPEPDPGKFPHSPADDEGGKIANDKLLSYKKSNLVYDMGNGNLFSDTDIKITKCLRNSYFVKIDGGKSFADMIGDVFRPDPSEPPGEDDIFEPDPAPPVIPDLPDDTKPIRPVSLDKTFISAGYKGYYNDFGFHSGVDYATSDGSIGTENIYATQDGVVIFVNSSCASYLGWHLGDMCGGGYGNFVKIKHTSDDYYSLYGHMHTIEVAYGQKVRKGQKIGTIGNSGNSTGAHLHFEVSKADSWGPSQVDRNVINPAVYLGLI